MLHGFSATHVLDGSIMTAQVLVMSTLIVASTVDAKCNIPIHL